MGSPDTAEYHARSEVASYYPLFLRDSVSNSAVKTAVQRVGRNFVDFDSLRFFYGLFRPIRDDASSETLWDQVGLAFQVYPYAERRDQENLLELTRHALSSLVNLPQERRVQGETRVIAPHVRDAVVQAIAAFDEFRREELLRLAQQKKPKLDIPVPKILRRAAPALGVIAAACEPFATPRTPDAGTAPPPGITLVVEGSPTPDALIQNPEKAPTPAILATPTEVLTDFAPPVNPPEFEPHGSGGAFPESIQEQARTDRYRVLLVLARQEGRVITGSNDQEVYSQLDAYAVERRLEVKQEWNNKLGDEYQMASFNIEQRADGSQLVYWYATPGGALSARPDIPASLDSSLIGISINDGFHPEWRWGGDGNVYMYTVDNATGEAVYWFNTTKADAQIEGGLVDAWEELASNWESLPRWDERRTAWEQTGIAGEYQGTRVTIEIEIDKSLYERVSYPIQGWQENHGTFKDIANTVAAGVSFMPQAGGGMRIVEPNMILHEDGTYESFGMTEYNPRLIGRSINQEQQFDPSIPIQTKWFDGDKDNVFPLQPYTNGNSYGWGVDPETKGLVIFIGLTSGFPPNAKTLTLDGNILEVLFTITNTSYGGDIRNKQQLDAMINQWIGGDNERVDTFAIDGGTLSPIMPSLGF